MPSKIVADHSYSDSELLAILREQAAKIGKFGQAYDIRGRRIDRADLSALMREIERLETKINNASRGMARNLYRRPAV